MDHSDGRRRPGGDQAIPRPPTWRPGPPPVWDGVDVSPLRDLDHVLQALRTSGYDPARSSPLTADARASAVLVGLVDSSEGAEVLLTRRAGHLRNHRGEVSFPGGRVEPGESVEHAAIREAHEEVALDPALVEVHGELDHLATMVSRSHIVPIVARLRERPSLHPNPDEVERVLFVPLVELARPDTVRSERWGTPPLDRELYFFDLDDETIWGATGRMLYQLLAVALGCGAALPPAW